MDTTLNLGVDTSGIKRAIGDLSGLADIGRRVQDTMKAFADVAKGAALGLKDGAKQGFNEWAEGQRKLAEESRRATEQIKKQNEEIKKQAEATKDVTDKLSGYMKMAAGAFSVKSVIESADAWGQYASRIKNATATTGEAEEATRRLMDVSNAAYKSYGNSVEIFVRAREPMKELGYTMDETLRVVEALQLGLVTSSASQEKSISVIDAFSKALITGKMNTEQFNSVISGAPTLQKAMADGLGVTIQQLQKMASEGKLTTDVLVKALPAEAIEKLTRAAEAMPVTVADAFQRMRNSFMQFTGETKSVVGVIGMLTTGITKIADSLHIVVPAVATFISLKFAIELVSVANAARLAVAQMVALGTAAKTTSALLAGIGGPLGLLVTLVGTIGVAAWQAFSTSAKDAATGVVGDVARMTGSIDELLKKWSELNVAQRESVFKIKTNDLDEAVSKSKAGIEELANAIQYSSERGTRGIAKLRSAFKDELTVILNDTSLSSDQMAEALQSLVAKYDVAGSGAARHGDKLTTLKLNLLESSTAARTLAGELNALSVAQGAAASSADREAAAQAKQLAEFMKGFQTAAEKRKEQMAQAKIDASKLGAGPEELKKIEAYFASLGGGASKAAKGVNELSDEHKKLIAELNAGVEAMDDARKLLESLVPSDLSEDFQKQVEMLDMLFDTGRMGEGEAALKKYQQALSALINNQPGAIKSVRDWEDAQKAAADATKAAAEAAEKWKAAQDELLKPSRELTETLVKENATLKQQLETYGMTQQQVNRLTIAKLEQAKADLKATAAAGEMTDALAEQIEQIDKQIALLKDQNKLLGDVEALDAQKRGWEDIANVSADFFVDLLQNGRDAFDNLAKFAKRAFMELAGQFAQKFILNIGANMSGGAGQAASGILSQLGGGSSMLGNLGSLGGLSTGLMNGLSAWGSGGSVIGVLSNPGLYSAIELLGTALPIIGGIIAAIAIFGRDKKGTKIDNSVLDGSRRADLIDSALGKFDVSGDLGNDVYKPLIERVQQLDQYIADNLLGDDALQRVKDNLQRISSDATNWWGYKDQESAAKAIEAASKHFLQQRYSTVFNEIDSGVAQMIKAFQGSADELLQFIGKAVIGVEVLKELTAQIPNLTMNLGEYMRLTEAQQTDLLAIAQAYATMSANIGKTAKEQFELSTAGVIAQFIKYGDALDEMNDAFRAGKVSATQLAEATEAYAQSAIEVSMALLQAQANITNSIADGKRSIELMGLGTDDKNDYLRNEAERLRGLIQTTTDPAKIQDYVNRIISNSTEVFGSLSPEEQNKYRQEWIDGLDKLQQEADKRIEDLNKVILENTQTTFEGIQDGLAEAVKQMQEAAATSNTAADKFDDAATLLSNTVQSGISVRVEGNYSYAEVGGA